MSILRRILQPEVRDLSFQDVWGRGDTWTGGASTTSGEKVTATSALSLSAVWGSVRIISEGVATLPQEAWRGKPGDPGHALAERPPGWLASPSESAFAIDIWSQVMVSLLLRGNAYVATPRDAEGFVTALVPLDPDTMEPVQVDGEVFYRRTDRANGRLFTRFEVLHVKGMVWPGSLVGLDPITYCAETLGLGLAAQRYGSAFFGNGATPSGVVELEGELTPVAARVMRRGWEEMHKGASKSGGLAVLTEGAKYRPISVTPEQAQFLATRGFQVADVARIFGVPPHLLGDASGSTSWGSGLAEQSVNYVTHSLRPWVERIEQALTWLARSERPTKTGQQALTIRLRMDHLLRGDFATRVSTYGSGLDRGIWSLNEVRAYEGLPPIPDGDAHRVPLNTSPVAHEELKLKADLKAKDAASKAASAPPPPPPPPQDEPPAEEGQQ